MADRHAPELSAVGADDGTRLARTARGEHFEVICHFEGAGLAEVALEAAEAAWPLATEFYGEIVESEPGYAAGDKERRANDRRAIEVQARALHRIHLYPDADAYRAVEAQITGGYFANNLAFTSWLTFETHIALQPSGDPQVRAGIGLSMLTRRLVAHEAVHQVCYRAIPTHRMHPDWLSEGLANWISDRVMQQKGWSLPTEQEPYTATDISRVQGLLAEGRMPEVERILQVGIQGKAALPDLSPAERYAVYWMFVDYLMSGQAREGFRHLMTSCRSLRGRSFPWTFIEDFNTFLVPGGLDKLDQGLAGHVRALHPHWKQEGRGLEWDGKGWVQISFPQAAAKAWNIERLPAAGFQLEGQLLWIGERKPPAELLLGHHLFGAQATLTIEIHAAGRVRLRSAEKVLAEGRADSMADSPIAENGSAFRLTVEGDRLRLNVGADLVLDEPLQGLKLDGRWGVAAPAGAALRWGALRVLELD